MKKIAFLLLAFALAGCASVPKLPTYINAPMVTINHGKLIQKSFSNGE
jgi:starvation-inducible outer membrane lipoprotein